MHFVSKPACARARCAHENVHNNGADVWLRRTAHAPTMRGASAYLVVNLRLPFELHLDLAQIRDGVLSRWAAGCHGHGAARERALRFVLAARTAHRRSTLGAGTLFPSQHTAAMIRAGLAGKSILTARVFDGSGPDTAYEAVGAIGKEEPLDAGSSTGVGASLLKGIRSWPMRLAYFPVDASDGLPEYEIGFRMYANGVSTDLELDYGDFTVAGLLSQIEALPDPGC